MLKLKSLYEVFQESFHEAISTLSEADFVRFHETPQKCLED